MGILDGLEALGLGKLKSIDTIYEEEQHKSTQEETPQAPPKKEEKDFLMEKEFECPVCQGKFRQRLARTTLKCIRHDRDLRPVYEGIDAVKYDVIFCPDCGYAVLSRFFAPLAPTHRKLLNEGIRKNFKPQSRNLPETISYEDAALRYKMALANAVVKLSKNSEKAYICLKAAWLYRGMREDAIAKGETDKDAIKAMAETEKEYLITAADGFIKARAGETPPYAGMNSTTLDYVIAAIYLETDTNLKDGVKLLQDVITSRTATPQNKEKARELLAEIKKKMGIE
ncbi:MAG: DUF2225 domain-containing protein [Lachnospiraceae bacterium]|nr:DUF2225 domain-containing protein [Lachnospiraceae bacterium]